MNPEKFVEIQRQMQENNVEMSNFLDGFTDWKESVGLKNKKLMENTSPKSNPAIRNSLMKKQKKNPSKIVSKSKKSERIRGYDYGAWDKFDVDKVLKESDSSQSDNQKSSNETDEEMEDQRRIQLSREARELGNIRFKENKCEDAIEQYTQAILLAPEDPIAYTNRALVFLKMERYASAEADCSLALRMDENSIKALFRRAMARKFLDKTNEAIDDLNMLLKLNPNNKLALDEFKKLTDKDKINEPNSNVLPGQVSGSGNNLPLDVTRPKLRRIPIVEVGNSSFPTVNPKTKLNVSLPSKPTFEVTNQKLEMSNDDGVVKKDSMIYPYTNSKVPIPVSDNKSVDSQINHMTKPNSRITLDRRISKSPNNWFQLERELREFCPSNMKTLTPDAMTYLCNIRPEGYLNLFGQNLETAFLCFMLAAFSKSQLLAPPELADRLMAICKLPRFDLAWLMADDEERLGVKKLITFLSTSNLVDSEMVKYITKQFE